MCSDPCGADPGLDGGSVELPLVEPSVAEARRFLSRTTAGWWSTRESVEEGLPIAHLLLTELVTNALVHAADGERLQVVTCRRDDVLRVEVHDGSSLLPLVREATDDDESGRGTLLLSRLALDWGAGPDDRGGKTVWFTLALSR